MSTFFVDSSALAKRYLTEVGSNWVIQWIEPAAGNVVIVSELALAEMQSLLARREREGAITTANSNALRSDFSSITRMIILLCLWIQILSRRQVVY